MNVIWSIIMAHEKRLFGVMCGGEDGCSRSHIGIRRMAIPGLISVYDAAVPPHRFISYHDTLPGKGAHCSFSELQLLCKIYHQGGMNQR
jgi:hypothetical protein